jgi:cell division protein FtsW
MATSISTAAEDRGFDRPLFISVILLVGFGIVMVYSASAVRASYEHNDPTHFLVRQVIYAVLGIVAMLIASQIDYRFYKKIIYPLLGLSVLGLLLCHSPLGRTINGASRWIGLGPMTIQPAEVVKLAMVLWLSYSLAKKSDQIKSFSIGFLPHLLVPGVVILLCLLQPDFGTSVIIAVMTFSLLFVAGAKLGYMMLAAIGAAPIVYFLVAGSDYRLKRILAFLDPISHRYDEAYQLIQSLYGFAGGGLWGTGLGDGLQKFFFLPEAHNDFIAAIIAEEFGVIGIWVLIVVFVVLLARGVIIALRAQDEFGTYVAFGITILIGVQTLANLGVSMGLLPTKGLNLPFISAGGSALVVSLFSVGILLNISKERYAALEPARTSRPSSENLRRSDNGKREKR